MATSRPEIPGSRVGRMLVPVILVCLPAAAQFAKPEDAIRYRQSAYVIMGQQMSNIAAQLKSDKPDVAAIQRSAGIIDFASQLPGEGYIPGSETGGVPATRAKPEVFKDPKASLDARAYAARTLGLLGLARWRRRRCGQRPHRSADRR